jgi:hypothetical protein
MPRAGKEHIILSKKINIARAGYITVLVLVVELLLHSICNDLAS